jgi:hypothetical protein
MKGVDAGPRDGSKKRLRIAAASACVDLKKTIAREASHLVLNSSPPVQVFAAFCAILGRSRITLYDCWLVTGRQPAMLTPFPWPE